MSVRHVRFALCLPLQNFSRVRAPQVNQTETKVIKNFSTPIISVLQKYEIKSIFNKLF